MESLKQLQQATKAATAAAMDNGLRRHLIALALTAPAMGATLVMQLELSFATMLFEGGRRVFLANVSEALLFPYVAVFMLALGTLLLPRPASFEQTQLQVLDLQLIRFFGGASLLVIGGFGLGLAKLLYAWLTAPIFCGVLYLYFLRAPDSFRKVLEWAAARDAAHADADLQDILVRYACVLLRMFALGVVIFFLLVSGILLNLYSSDDMQLYFPYLAEVRHQHSIWLDPAHPVYSDFLIGRGNGAHLFFASFTNEFFGQIISVVYLVIATLVIRQAVCLIVPRAPDSPWKVAQTVLPDCAMVLVLTSAIVGLDTAKYHTQTNAFLLFLSWSSLLFLTTKRYQARWLFCMLVPVVVAIPIMLPQYQAPAAVSLATAIAALYLAGRQELVRYGGILIAIGVTVMAGSLAFNQLYIGVAELNPAWLFLGFRNAEIFGQWSSPVLIQYLQLTQEWPSTWTTFAFPGMRSIFIQSIYVAAFAYPLFLLFRRSSFAPSLANALRDITPSVCAFIGAFLFTYLLGRVISLLTSHNSLLRLLQFQSAYLPFFYVAALVFAMALLLHRNRVEVESPKHRGIWLPIAAGVLFALIGVQVAIIGYGFPISGRIALGLIVVLVVALLVVKRGLKKSTAFASLSTLPSIRFATRNIRWWPAFFVLLAAIVLYRSFTTFRWQYHAAVSVSLGSAAGVRAVRYFFGMEGLIESVPKTGWAAFNFRRCLEIAQAVPGDTRVLPLNANYNLVPCYNSPLLPRGKIVHHYESTLAPKFEDIALGSAEHAAGILRKSGIEYFYLQKEDNDFFGPAFGELFSAENLQRRFDVYRETDGFVILTWRDHGYAPVSGAQAAYIDALRRDGCDNPANPMINNCRGFLKLKNWHEQLRIK